MDIKEFEQQFQMHVRAFASYWTLNHYRCPEGFPLSLDNEAEWFEQYMSWAGYEEDM